LGEHFLEYRSIVRSQIEAQLQTFLEAQASEAPAKVRQLDAA
jgi:hypothetical protein